MKTNKHQTLLLVKERNAVRAHDLAQAFEYSPPTARSYLSYLLRQGLLQRTGSGHELTDKGQERLHFFEVTGCANPDCPRCQGKAGYVTCPSCGWRVARRKVSLRPVWETLLFRRDAGVYCPLCQARVLTPDQAELMGIRGKGR